MTAINPTLDAALPLSSEYPVYRNVIGNSIRARANILSSSSITLTVRCFGRGVRQLHVHEHVTLVFGGHKTSWQGAKAPARQRHQTTENQHDDQNQAHGPANHAFVGTGGDIEARLKARKKKNLASLGFRNTIPHKAGLSVNALIVLISTAAEIVSANCLNNWPVIPLIKAVGTKTASNTSVVAMTGPVISRMAVMAASLGLQSFGDVPGGAFHNHDRIIDDDADRQHDAKQRQHI